MFSVSDYTSECFDGQRQFRGERPDKIIIHRISFEHDDVSPVPDVSLQAIDVSAMFMDQGKYRAGYYTGGHIPYTFLVTASGECQQMMPVCEIGWHAKRWSSTGVGVAVAGNFNLRSPTKHQVDTLVKVCSVFGAIGMSVYGHTELPLSSRDPTKQCPGENLDMNWLRGKVRYNRKEVSEKHANAMLKQAGVVW